MTRLLPVAAIVFALCAPVYAQKQQVAKFPKGLKWEMMSHVAFNYPPFPESATSPELRKTAEHIWAKELDALPTDTFPKAGGGTRTGKYPAFILMSSNESDNIKHVFSIMDAGPYDKCEHDHSSEYSVCVMRMVTEDKKTGKTQQRDYKNFCFLHLLSDDGASEDENTKNNHTEIAFDKKSKTVYFRIVQDGKVVPACNRQVSLPQ